MSTQSNWTFTSLNKEFTFFDSIRWSYPVQFSKTLIFIRPIVSRNIFASCAKKKKERKWNWTQRGFFLSPITISIHLIHTSIAVPLCDYYDYGYWSFDTVYHFVNPLPNTRAWIQLSVQLIHPCSILYNPKVNSWANSFNSIQRIREFIKWLL